LEYAVSGPPGKPAEEDEKLLAFVSVPASLGLCMALALFFGVTASRERVAEW
jgi:hypothetical protein